MTVVHPRGKKSNDPVFAAWFTLNGNGEMTGTTWIRERLPRRPHRHHQYPQRRHCPRRHPAVQAKRPGPALGPSGGRRDADGGLNDINGFHVTAEHTIAALDGATTGPVAEGNVGGGTGMVCHGFKGGIGTASRVLSKNEGAYTVGVLVQCNYGRRSEFRVGGVPVGEEIPDVTPCISIDNPPRRRAGAAARTRTRKARTEGPGRSSSSSPPTRPCCRINCNAS